MMLEFLEGMLSFMLQACLTTREEKQRTCLYIHSSGCLTSDDHGILQALSVVSGSSEIMLGQMELACTEVVQII